LGIGSLAVWLKRAYAQGQATWPERWRDFKASEDP
jgi:hypothetical protein